ncbi:hypothetical protein K438DRAFT_1948634 [Mycena galopus ATCC 62051]|nr:hypothetical protein K438DRAFT_1948634 [Mycena galopus ATCC 62051]
MINYLEQRANTTGKSDLRILTIGFSSPHVPQDPKRRLWSLVSTLPFDRESLCLCIDRRQHPGLVDIDVQTLNGGVSHMSKNWCPVTLVSLIRPWWEESTSFIAVSRPRCACVIGDELREEANSQLQIRKEPEASEKKGIKESRQQAVSGMSLAAPHLIIAASKLGQVINTRAAVSTTEGRKFPDRDRHRRSQAACPAAASGKALQIPVIERSVVSSYIWKRDSRSVTPTLICIEPAPPQHVGPIPNQAPSSKKKIRPET